MRDSNVFAERARQALRRTAREQAASAEKVETLGGASAAPAGEGEGARRLARPALLLPLLLLVSGCAELHSPLYARGYAAEIIADFFWIVFGVGTAIFLLVVGIMLYAIVTPPERKPRFNAAKWVIGWGIVFPIVVLTPLLFFTMKVGAAVRPGVAPPDRLVVEITGHQWWWEIRYVGATPNLDVVTANELHLPVGRPVQLVLTSGDVIHSFWLPNVAGKMDMIPGRVNTLTVTATETGFALGRCAEFCGAQHARMRLQAVLEEPDDFEDWLELQRQPAQPPTDPELVAGLNLFIGSGCPVCHTITGTGAAGKVAPDLTHLASRRNIAAGTLANTLGNRMAWIARAQHFKPEAEMPSFNEFERQELMLLAKYLGSLR